MRVIWHCELFDTIPVLYRLTLHCVLRKFVYLQKTQTLPSGTVSQTLHFEKCCRGGTSAVASVVNSRLFITLSVRLCAQRDVTQSVTRVRLRHLRLVS